MFPNSDEKGSEIGMAIFGKGTKFLYETTGDFRDYYNLGRSLSEVKTLNIYEEQISRDIHIDIYSDDVRKTVSDEKGKEKYNVRIPAANGDVISIDVNDSAVEKLDNGFYRVNLGRYDNKLPVDVMHPDGSVSMKGMPVTDITDAYVGYRWSLYSEKFNKSDKLTSYNLCKSIRDSFSKFKKDHWSFIDEDTYQNELDWNEKRNFKSHIEHVAEKMFYVDKKSNAINDLVMSDRRLSAKNEPRPVLEGIPVDAVGPGVSDGEVPDKFKSIRFTVSDKMGRENTGCLNVPNDCIEEHGDGTVNVKLWKIPSLSHFVRYEDKPDCGKWMTNNDIIDTCKEQYEKSVTRSKMAMNELSGTESKLQEIATNDYDTHSEFDT